MCKEITLDTIMLTLLSQMYQGDIIADIKYIHNLDNMDGKIGQKYYILLKGYLNYQDYKDTPVV